MESLSVDHFASFVEVTELNEKSEIFNASETANVKKDDVVSIELAGGLI